MKKISRLFMILGCLCILVSCCLFGYSQYEKRKQIKEIQSLYQATVPLIPETYIPSETSYLDIQGHDIEGIVQNSKIHWVLSHEEGFPQYKQKSLVVPEVLLTQMETLKNKEKLTIKTASGQVSTYELEVIGFVDQLSTKKNIMYCKTSSRYYCINMIEVNI